MIERGALVLQRLAALDAWLFLTLNGVHDRINLEKLVRWVSFSGDGYLYLLMAVALPWLFPEQGTTFLLAGLLGFVIELPVYWVLKNSFKRRRPFHVVKAMAPALKPSDEFSFPSGHTTAAFMVAGVTSMCFPGAALFVYCWATLIGLSRVMLKVHFISDVLAGILLGSLLAFFSIAVTAPL